MTMKMRSRSLKSRHIISLSQWYIHASLKNIHQLIKGIAQDPSQSGSSEILFTRLFLYKMPVFEKGSNSTKNLQNRFKVNQFIYTLVRNYMANIRILAKAVLQISCSQGCSYTKCLCPKKGNNSTENLRNGFKIRSVDLHLDL